MFIESTIKSFLSSSNTNEYSVELREEYSLISIGGTEGRVLLIVLEELREEYSLISIGGTEGRVLLIVLEELREEYSL